MHYNTIKTNWITLFHSIIWSEANSIYKQGQVWITNIANWNLKWMHAFCIYFPCTLLTDTYTTYTYTDTDTWMYVCYPLPQSRHATFAFINVFLKLDYIFRLLVCFFAYNIRVMKTDLPKFKVTEIRFVCTVQWSVRWWEHIPKWPIRLNSIRQV